MTARQPALFHLSRGPRRQQPHVAYTGAECILFGCPFCGWMAWRFVPGHLLGEAEKGIQCERCTRGLKQ